MIKCAKCGSTEKFKGGACKPCKKAWTAKWREENADKIKAQARTRYLATREHQLSVQKAKRVKNPELYKTRVKNWTDNNAVRMIALRKRWKAENRERVCVHAQNRRARISSSGGDIRDVEIKRLMFLQKNRCAVCTTSIRKSFHADHIIALANCGDNTIHNIQLLCPKCNLQKGIKHPICFMQSRGFLL